MNIRWREATTMHYKLPAAVLVSLLLTSVAAHPAGPNTSKGGQLARQWCASCHITGGNPVGNVQQGPPSFPTIARARTADQLHAFLSHPHGAMPDLSLTRAEIDDLVSYIETLR
jgi:mono/diheme cytochrome c family protein